MNTHHTAVALSFLAFLAVNTQAQNAPPPTPAPAPAAKVTPNSAQNNKPAITGVAPTAPAPAPKPGAKPAQPAANAAAKTPGADAPTPVATAAPAPAAVEAAGAPGSKVAAAAPKIPVRPPPCPVSEFRALGMDTGDAAQRRNKALAWLAKKGQECTAEKLVALRNNRAHWMGAADSSVVAAAIDGLLEASAENNPAVINLLYGTVLPPPKPPEEKPPNKAP